MTALRRMLVPLAFAIFAMVEVPVAALCATVTPAPTPPPNQHVTFTYKTFLDPATVDYWQIRAFDVDFGTMTLTFDPDKTITGTYAPDFGNPTKVTGSVTGTGTLSLQIGSRPFAGRFTPRGIAVAFGPAASSMGRRLWGQFVRATPATANSR
ncbi:MAG: hypothetical protein JWM87_4600 [Candidatus Eremiobacteraeota bacterium]|nr:hypothetical protein [Candidatus Eremiobacteraeota bacterium]